MLSFSFSTPCASALSSVSAAGPGFSAQIRALPQRAVSRRICAAVVRPLSPRRFTSCSTMRITSLMPFSPLPTFRIASFAVPPRTTKSGISSLRSGERLI